MRALLDYGRPRRVAPHAVLMEDTISSAVELLRNQGKLDRVELEVKLDGSLRPVRGDRHALEQVIVNLLLNAVDASPRNGRIFVGARLANRAAAEGNAARRMHDDTDVSMPRASANRFESWRDIGGPAAFIEVIVADSGIGIPLADRERIFDPFFTTKEPGKGTGLGLALVARTLDDCDGIILVRRAREGGAAFVMLLPLIES
jgi:signal transduction histidine kinase